MQFTGFSEAVNASEYEDCSTRRSVLLKALFETKGNLFELDRIFSPARIHKSDIIYFLGQ